jgi:hypothetical protein
MVKSALCFPLNKSKLIHHCNKLLILTLILELDLDLDLDLGLDAPQ